MIMEYKLPHYFNTTRLKGTQLKSEIMTAISQEKIIFNLFKRKRVLSPSEIYRLRMSSGLGDIPITSIRRGITNLTNLGRLKKTDRQRLGMYGKPEFIWEIDTRQQKIF